MRLWHKDLITALPQKQLVSQWRECCSIAKKISNNGTPNHILVNRILDYPIQDFIDYCNLVLHEMLVVRGFNVSSRAIGILEDSIGFVVDSKLNYDIFPDWHNSRYFVQCFYNLQEKFDCGGISQLEWSLVCKSFNLYVKQCVDSEERSIEK